MAKSYVPVVTLSTTGNQKPSALFSKWFGKTVYWNGYKIKIKIDDKSTTNEIRFFLESNFVGENRILVLVYPNEDAASKRFKAKW